MYIHINSFLVEVTCQFLRSPWPCPLPWKQSHDIKALWFCAVTSLVTSRSTEPESISRSDFQQSSRNLWIPQDSEPPTREERFIGESDYESPPSPTGRDGLARVTLCDYSYTPSRGGFGSVGFTNGMGPFLALTLFWPFYVATLFDTGLPVCRGGWKKNIKGASAGRYNLIYKMDSSRRRTLALAVLLDEEEEQAPKRRFCLNPFCKLSCIALRSRP